MTVVLLCWCCGVGVYGVVWGGVWYVWSWCGGAGLVCVELQHVHYNSRTHIHTPQHNQYHTQYNIQHQVPLLLTVYLLVTVSQFRVLQEEEEASHASFFEVCTAYVCMCVRARVYVMSSTAHVCYGLHLDCIYL